MKSEHRHELAENDLSKVLTRFLEKAEPHSNKILLAALAVTVVVVAVVSNAFSALTLWWMLRFSWETHHRIATRLFAG